MKAVWKMVPIGSALSARAALLIIVALTENLIALGERTEAIRSGNSFIR